MKLSLASAKKLKQEDFRKLEKDSLLYSPSVTFPSSDTDSFEETSSLASQSSNHDLKSNNNDSNGDESCGDDTDTILSHGIGSVDDNSCFNYPLYEISHSNDNHNFLENKEDNDFSDCLYSGWPEIGNFEDVDRMFRSCDSTFGFGASNEYGSGCVIHKEQVNDHKEQLKLHNKSLGNQIKVATDELGMSGKRPSLSGNFGDVAMAELGSFNAKEIIKTKSKSSGSGDIFREASSFCQLQLVMEQLDSRTKICMKDNLYRLARSAEQRHKHVNLNGYYGDGRDPNGALKAKRKHGYATSFMDVEKDTNSIGRSIAHLLFYTPSESSAVDA